MRYLTALLFLLALPLAAEETIELCLSCHGTNGQSHTGLLPSIGGQRPAYLLIQLYMFREEMRISEVMNEVAKTLSDADLRSLSDAIAALPPPHLPAESGDPSRMQKARALAEQEHCFSCHSQDLSGRDNIPRLAGQREDYLARTLRDYKTNLRAGYDGSMAEVLQPVSEAQIDDLAYFIAHFH